MKILVVDDQIYNRLILKEIIDIFDYECIMAKNGKECIDILEKENFDAIFMDIEMPVMDGLEAIYNIRKMQYPKNKTPVFVISAHKSLDLDDENFDGFVEKPFSVELIENILKKIKKK